MDLATVSYRDDFNNRTVNKRTEIFRYPRSFRFSATVEY